MSGYPSKRAHHSGDTGPSSVVRGPAGEILGVRRLQVVRA